MFSSTLRPCPAGLAPSSGLLLTSRPPRSSHAPATYQPRSSLKPINPRSGVGVVRARSGAAQDRQVVDHEFREERDKIEEYSKKFRNADLLEFREERDKIEEYLKKFRNASVLRSEGAVSRGYLCMIAKNSARLASDIMGKPGDVSPDTLLTEPRTRTKSHNQALQRCVRTFVSTAEDAYNDKVTKETIVSFLRDLELLAAISCFMAEDTPANVGDYKVISLNCRSYQLEYMGKMDTLKHDLTMSHSDDERVLRNIAIDAMLLTEPFVMSMTACRGNAL